MSRWTRSPDALDKIGVPTVKSGAHFQRNVANMNVYSNVKGIVAGTGLAGGNIEFWPNNYGPANSANVPNASAEVCDFGDAAERTRRTATARCRSITTPPSKRSLP